MKETLRKIVPQSVQDLYYKTIVWIGSFKNMFPSRKLVVIGVTGTKGKTTTCSFIADLLTASGYKVGVATTAFFRIGEKSWSNTTKQTMQGRFKLQGFLKRLVREECEVAIVETSSEGIKQFRHLYIDYDIAVFTNITPEHIESHGSFENYLAAKNELFKTLGKTRSKKLHGREIKKTIVANMDSKYIEKIWSNWSEEKYGFGTDNTWKDYASKYRGDGFINAIDVSQGQEYLQFMIQTKSGNKLARIPIVGQFNIYNLLASMLATYSVTGNFEEVVKNLSYIKEVPGRMEEIKEGQKFRVFVDYAHEPVGLESVYKTLDQIKTGKIISVLGSQGGGRDKRKRGVMGGIAAKYTDNVIITNEDPYDDDPKQIIDEVADGALGEGKKEDENLWKILDRRDAIKKALSLAEANDIVILTGKGSEKCIVAKGGQRIDWDEREVAKYLLKKMIKDKGN